MMTRQEILQTLTDVAGLPVYKSKTRKTPNFRTIYEAGKGPRLKPSGQFFIDYPSYPGGSSNEVPLSIIEELEAEGLLTRAYPDKPQIKAWVLKP